MTIQKLFLVLLTVYFLLLDSNIALALNEVEGRKIHKEYTNPKETPSWLDGRKVYTELGIFDSKRQASNAIKEIFKVKDLGKMRLA